MVTTLTWLLVLYALSSLIPVSKSDAWWVRVFDFPRLQLFAFGILVSIAYAWVAKLDGIQPIALLGLGLAGIALDAYRVVPYSGLVRIQSLSATKQTEAERISLLVANVLQTNEDFESMLALVSARQPDVVFLTETNALWVEKMSPLEETYPHRVLQPQENTYGLALYSRLPLNCAKVAFLVEPDIPSVQALLTLRSGSVIEIFAIHPRPPRPDSKRTTERDAELVVVAGLVKKSRYPVLVMGDLNDVAWSHTSRLFRRISGLLDPRIGRGTFPTFPVAFYGMRFPLDHVFHSASMRIARIERGPAVGSDHFPLLATFNHEPEVRHEHDVPMADASDVEEARATVEKAATTQA